MFIPAYLKQPIVIPHWNKTTTNLDLQIFRVSDKFWLDFSDLAFKNSAWTDKDGDMTEDDDDVFTYDWTVPNATEIYYIYIMDKDSGFNQFAHSVSVRGGTFFTMQGTPTATVIDTDLDEAVDDYFKAPSLVKILTGSLKGQTGKLPVSGSYDGTGTVGEITLQTGLSSAPSSGNTGIVITE